MGKVQHPRMWNNLFLQSTTFTQKIKVESTGTPTLKNPRDSWLLAEAKNPLNLTNPYVGGGTP